MSSNDFRRRKTNERLMNQAIFENISLLSRLSPVSNQLKSILHANMFAKPNKAAFQEVTFYLLTVTEPQLAKEKLKSWPLISPRQEVQYRTELIECVTVLNSRHKYADIPVFQPSQLVSPGGYRIAGLILKLSQLAISEQLKSSGIVVASPSKPSANCEIKTSQIFALNQTALAIEKQSEEMLVEFNTDYFRMRNKAQFISNLIRKLHMEDIQRCNNELEEIKAKHQSSELPSLDLEVSDVKQRVDKILEINHFFATSKVLLKQLADLTLKHDPASVSVPAEIAHLIPSQAGQLDLVQYFDGLTAWLEKLVLRIPSLSPNFIRQKVEEIEEMLRKKQSILQELKSHDIKVKNLLEQIKGSCRAIE